MNPNIGNDNCPTCCANRREDRRIVDECDDGDTYCPDPWHATPTPPAPADDAGVERIIQALGAETGVQRLYGHERMAFVRAVLAAKHPAPDAGAAERAVVEAMALYPIVYRGAGGHWHAGPGRGRLPYYALTPDELRAALRGTKGA